MVRNDDFFLSKWVGYYGRQLGKENLHVIFDGLDQKVPEFCDGVNVERVEHVKGNVHEADRGRIDLISQRAARLFDRYDMVIGTDVDEFLVVDPLLGKDSRPVPLGRDDRTPFDFRTRRGRGAEDRGGGGHRRLAPVPEPAELCQALHPL